MELSPLRVEVNYAALMGTYYTGYCALGAYTAVYLSWMGLSDANIGYVSSLIHLLTMAGSLLLAMWADRQEGGIKGLLSGTLLLTAVGSLLIWLCPLPVWVNIGLYALISSLNAASAALFTTLLMEYINAGMPVRYGWPRGVGSITYASMAFALGTLTHRFTPGIILPLFLAFDAGSLLFLGIMPRVPAGTARVREIPKHRSVGAMVGGNPTLALLLLAGIFSGAGIAISTTYLVRVVERLGGNSEQLGLAIFLQSGVELPMMILSSALLRRFKAGELLLASFVAVTIKMLLLNHVGAMGALYAVMCTSILCFGIYGFAAPLFANQISAPGETARVQSLLSLCYSSGLGGILGNLLAGAIIDRAGLTAVFYLAFGLCGVGAVIMGLCLRSRNRNQT